MWQTQKKEANRTTCTHVDGNRMAKLQIVLVYRKKVLGHFLTTFFFTWSPSPEVWMEHFIVLSPEKFRKFHILWLGGNQKAQVPDTAEVHIRSSFLYVVLFEIRATETGLSCVHVSEEGHGILLIKICQKWEKGFWHCLLCEVDLLYFLHYKIVKI